jgi:putative membrane protein
LAIVSGLGVAAVGMGHKAVGAALVFAGVGSMAAAAVVLLLSAPEKARAALTQGAFPVIAIVLLLLGLRQ